MSTAIAYARYSSDNQRQESIDAQLQAIRLYAKNEGIVITQVFVDAAESAKTDDRPQFQAMFDAIKEHPPSFVIVHKLDRFSRNRYDAAIYRKKLKDVGTVLLSVLERFDDSPESIILQSVLEGYNEYYSRNLAREVMKGMLQNAQNGVWNGGIAPLGYDVVNQRLVINLKEAEAVKAIFSMYVDDTSYSNIQQWLSARGYRTKFGKPFGKNSLYSIISNEKYTGTYTFNMAAGVGNRHKKKAAEDIIRVPDAIPRLIDDETWAKAVERLQSKRLQNGKNNAKHEYLLQGLVYCGLCGGAMGGYTRKGKNGSIYSDYRCNASRQNKECQGRGVSRLALEEEVIARLKEKLLDPENMDAVTDKINDWMMKGVDENFSAVQEIKNRLASVDRKIRSIIDMLLDGIRSDTLKNDLEALETEKVFLNDKLDRLAVQLDTRQLGKEKLKKYLVHFKDLDTFAYERKKKALRTIVEKIVVMPDSVRIHAVVTTIGRGERT